MAVSWRHNLCSCSDVGTCFGSFFCYPCLFGRTTHRLENYPQKPDDTSFSWCNLPCVLMCCAAHVGFGWLPIWMQRAEMRKKFGIGGNSCTDCLSSCCCGCCAMVQQEVEVREKAELLPMLGMESGYQNQQHAMTYAAPVQQTGVLPATSYQQRYVEVPPSTHGVLGHAGGVVPMYGDRK